MAYNDWQVQQFETEPTWQNQLKFAEQLATEELKRHAAVSKDNLHRCEDCFCCAALTVLEQRMLRKQLSR